MKRTIFLTGGGGAGTIAAAKFLRSTGKYNVILGDMDKLAAGLNFADKAYVLPAAQDKKFIPEIRKIIKKENVDIFVPLVDEELLKTYGLIDEYPNLKLLLPRYEFTSNVLDKYKLVQCLKEAGVPCPQTALASDNFTFIEPPFIVKPRQGRGSRNVIAGRSHDQIQAYLKLFNLAPQQVLVQEKIEGKEFTVSVVANERGDVLAVVPKEVIYKRGVTITAVTRRNQEIEKICRLIQDKMRADGPFNVQLVVKDDGSPSVFEINPRYSTTIALTIAAGVNEIGLLVDEEERVGFQGFKENVVMSRFYEQIYFQE